MLKVALSLKTRSQTMMKMRMMMETLEMITTMTRLAITISEQLFSL